MKSKTRLSKEQKDVLKTMVSVVPTNLKFTSNTEKEVFALIYYMSSKHDGKQFTCGYNEFETSCGLHRNTVSRYIESLKCKGYINHSPGHKNRNSDFTCCVDNKGNIVHNDIVHNDIVHNTETNIVHNIEGNIVHNESSDNEAITPNIVHNIEENIVHNIESNIVHNTETNIVHNIEGNIVHNESSDNEVVTPNIVHNIEENIVHNNYTTLCTNNNNNNNNNNCYYTKTNLNNNNNNANANEYTKTILSNNNNNAKANDYTSSTIKYRDFEASFDSQIDNKINKTMDTTKTMTTTELEAVVNKLLSRVNDLEDAVKTLTENNNTLTERLNKAAIVIKGLMVNNAQVQTASSVRQPTIVDYEERKKFNDKLSQLWSVIDDKDSSMKSKLPAVQELKELVKSDLMSDKQRECSQFKIDRFSEVESEMNNEELISSKIESLLSQHKAIKEALKTENFEYIKANGEEYLKSVQGVEQLKKNKNLSKEGYAKVSTISRNNSAYREVEEYLQLVASKKLEGTKHTKDDVEDAKKNADIEKLNTLKLVMAEIDTIFNKMVNKLSNQNYKVDADDVKAEFYTEVNRINRYNPKEHTGLFVNAWSRLWNEVNIHNGKVTTTPQECMPYEANVNEPKSTNIETDDDDDDDDYRLLLPNGTYEENIKDFTEKYIEYMKREAHGEPINVDAGKSDYVDACRRLNSYTQTKESVITEHWLIANHELRQYNISISRLKRFA